MLLKNTTVQSKKHKQLSKYESYKLARFLLPRPGEKKKVTGITTLLLCLTAAVIAAAYSCLLREDSFIYSLECFALFSFYKFRYRI